MILSSGCDKKIGFFNLDDIDLEKQYEYGIEGVIDPHSALKKNDLK